MARAWFVARFPEGFEETDHADTLELAVYTDEAGEAGVRAAFAEVHAEPVEERVGRSLEDLPSTCSCRRALDRASVARSPGR